MAAAPRVRIAPSPTGYLHVGTARTALFNWLFARRHGGTFILRIEDTDVERHVPEAVAGIQRSLRWLGLDWDEGPYFQSERTDLYRDAADRLSGSGHAYYCDCTAEDIQRRNTEAGRPPGYDGFCRERGLAPGPARALRFRTADEGEVTVLDLVAEKPPTTQCATIGDFVLVKGNGDPLFLLANVVDDIEMRISHVIRGNDHLPNTPKYILLWEALDGGDLPVFAHLPMLVDASRKKLSKRKKHKVALEDYRDDGYLPEAMVNYLALLGWSPGGDREILALDEMIAAFRLEDVVPSPAFFDEKKQGFINGEYIRMLTADEFAARTSAWFRMRVLDPMAAHVQTRAVTLADAMGAVDFFVSEPLRYDPDAWTKAMDPGAGEVLDRVMSVYEAIPEDGWTAPTLHETTAAVAESLGLKLNKAQAPVRVAVTGRSVGPPLFESMVVLGRSRTMTRLRTARDRCSSP